MFADDLVSFECSSIRTTSADMTTSAAVYSSRRIVLIPALTLLMCYDRSNTTKTFCLEICSCACRSGFTDEEAHRCLLVFACLRGAHIGFRHSAIHIPAEDGSVLLFARIPTMQTIPKVMRQTCVACLSPPNPRPPRRFGDRLYSSATFSSRPPL